MLENLKSLITPAAMLLIAEIFNYYRSKKC